MFREYRRKQIAELRPVTQQDIQDYAANEGVIIVQAYAENSDPLIEVSITEADRSAGSPKLGDMIARNPKNHEDQWLVAKQYFEDNFEIVKE